MKNPLDGVKAGSTSAFSPSGAKAATTRDLAVQSGTAGRDAAFERSGMFQYFLKVSCRLPPSRTQERKKLRQERKKRLCLGRRKLRNRGR
jgi:hypothetical protein